MEDHWKQRKVELEEYEDHELAARWNYLETCKLSGHVEKEMNLIDEILHDRGVMAWNAKGEITDRW